MVTDERNLLAIAAEFRDICRQTQTAINNRGLSGALVQAEGHFRQASEEVHAEPDESNLVAHARAELSRAGLFDDDSDYGGMVGQAVMELIGTFSKQGHSGMSAGLVTDVFHRVVQYEPLTPITSDPAEWMDRSEISGVPMWQSNRNPALFSTDGGTTYYNVGDPEVVVTSATAP